MPGRRGKRAGPAAALLCDGPRTEPRRKPWGVRGSRTSTAGRPGADCPHGARRPVEDGCARSGWPRPPELRTFVAGWPRVRRLPGRSAACVALVDARCSTPSSAPATQASVTSRSSTVNRPAASARCRSRRARGASPRGAATRSKPMRWKILAIWGCVFGRRAVMRTAAANTSAGSTMPAVATSSDRAVLLEDLLDRGVEQVLLALEVVVEGAEPDVGRVGDLLDADLRRIARGEQHAGGLDERRPGAGLPSVQPARGDIGHDRSVSG